MKLITFDQALDYISVAIVDDCMIDANTVNLEAVKGLYYVIDDDGIRGYFASQTDAFAFRMFRINAYINNVTGRK